MFTFLCILSILVLVILLIISSMVPHRPSMSVYELEQRANEGDHVATASLRQLHNAGSVTDLVSIKVNVLLIMLSFLLVAAFGWAIGGISIIIILIIFRPIARLKLIHDISRSLYDSIEHRLFSLIENNSFVRIITRPTEHYHVPRISSRRELQHLIDQADDVLEPDVKKLIVSSLSFHNKVVGDIMTPSQSIISLKKSEFLGPLTLNDLHQSGHSQLPVISSDIDHIVGILHLDGLLALDIKRSVTAEKAMDSHVHYIREDETLPQALAAFLQTHSHLFIVIDGSRQTKGLVTLDDIIGTLTGHTLSDTFDGYESIRAVAEHTPSKQSD